MLLVDCAACLHRPPNIRQSPECGGRTSFVWKGHPPYLGTRKKNPVGIQGRLRSRVGSFPEARPVLGEVAVGNRGPLVGRLWVLPAVGLFRPPCMPAV